MKYQEQLVLLSLVLISLCVSAIQPFDRLTWLLEVLPVVIAVPLLLSTYKRFPLTPLLYRLIFVHSLILILGGHYTYARVPAGAWVQQAFDLSRNNYDRLGHFAQGFIPAMIAREILLRTTPVRPGKWLFFLVVCICLALSAFYEFIEWWSALIMGQAADDFLGTQGDPWDTQWDMFLAFSGAIIAQVLLSRRQDREMTG
ncbi:MAG: hypothetical protein A2078_00290 [Nitrospirae bacterium GWC2_57_9]|nr:MAG: hypothetical protein A2078_00290 [Nitrospirae bacterium GWC2_57_9]